MTGYPTEPSQDWAKRLTGPILVLGAGGFVGANLFLRVAASRTDVFGTVRQTPAWRLAGAAPRQVITVDLTDQAALTSMIAAIRPATVFHCAAYGAYSFENDGERIFATNVLSTMRLLEILRDIPLAAFVHAGSSSEYGTNCAGPEENATLQPNSPYAVSKVAAHYAIVYAGKTLAMPVVNLRLYSVYGPGEDSARLIPTLVKHGLAGGYPPLVAPDTARDFVYVDDVSEAFLIAAARMTPALHGESFNIATGKRTTIRDLAEIAQRIFTLDHPPAFGSMVGRSWDLANWYGAPAKAGRVLGWMARTPLEQGLRLTTDWVRSLGPGGLAALTKLNPNSAHDGTTSGHPGHHPAGTAAG